ncbi:hypothetical protein ID867_05950, partial [Streptomyces parvulus]|nr:hypothetical protein [Streptomyces parvulus]
MARSASIESSTSSSASCGIRPSAAALIAFSCRATAGSNLSIAPRWWEMIAQYVRTAFGTSRAASGSPAAPARTSSKARTKSSWRTSP